jgi:hypothetical protein
MIPFAFAHVLGLLPSSGVQAQVLDLPPRPGGAPGGGQIAREIRDLDLPSREERLFAEIARGNVPGWLRKLSPVEVAGEVGGRELQATFWVTPDYLAVGSEGDFLLVPLSPGIAQRIADRVGCLLPTPRMVDAVWAAARVHLEPLPIPPSPEMTTVPVFEAHGRMIAAQWRDVSAPRGSLVSGHKKDVVITGAVASLPNRVAIYGWHRLTGEPIQPLYAGHTERWVDYSHGIRLVLREMTLDGTPRDLPEVLRDPELAALLSDEGVIAEARYAISGG